MKNAMDFVKKRWPLFVSVLVIVVALPVAWFFSQGLNSKLKQRQESEANSLITQLDQLRVTYELPAPLAGMEPLSESGVMPHPRRTEFYRSQLERQRELLGSATQEIIDFNRKGRGTLVEGLFPIEPEDGSQAQLLRLRMQDVLIPRDGRSAYEQLLASVRATRPPEPQRVLDQLNDTRSRLFERERAQSGEVRLEPDEEAAMTQELTAQRISLYARPAQEFSIYMDLDVFPKGTVFEAAPTFPRQATAATPSHGLTFLWQLDYWLAQDLIGFLREANSRGGRLLPIVEAPVKRVLSIEGRPLKLNRLSGQRDERMGSDSVEPGPDPARELFEPRFNTAASGREADWLNQLYDIRRVRMSLVVDSSRIPQLFDAAARQNLITIVDLDIQPVDVWAHLEQGFYYGTDHVVQLDIEMELIYLRAWTAPLIPDIFRQELGLEYHPKPESDAEEDDFMDPGLG